MAQSIWGATGVTPAATDRIPVDVSSSGAASRWTGQQIADAAGFIGRTHNALGSISTATAINLANGTYVSATIAGPLEFTITNAPASPNGCEFTFVLTDGGSATITWPGSVTWASGTAPTLTASGVNVLHFATGNGGTNWYGWTEADEVYSPGGSSGQGQYNSAGSLAGMPLWVLDANTLAQYNGTSAQRAQWFRTRTNDTNYTRAILDTSPKTGWFQIRIEGAGTGLSNYSFAFSPLGSGAISAQLPTSSAVGGNDRGIYSIDWQLSRAAAAEVASGAYSSIGGGYGNKASNSYAQVGGGRANFATGYASTISGGERNLCSGLDSACLGGTDNIVSGEAGFNGAGTRNVISGSKSWCPGGDGSTTRGLTGAGAYASGYRAAVGDCQTMRMVVSGGTLDDTPIILTADMSGVPDTLNQMVLPDNSTLTFDALVTVRDIINNKSAGWIIQGVAQRGASAANTVIVGTNATTALGSNLIGTATVAVIADTTSGAISIEFTGIAATELYPVANIRIVQSVG